MTALSVDVDSNRHLYSAMLFLLNNIPLIHCCNYNVLKPLQHEIIIRQKNLGACRDET